MGRLGGHATLVSYYYFASRLDYRGRTRDERLRLSEAAAGVQDAGEAAPRGSGLGPGARGGPLSPSPEVGRGELLASVELESGTLGGALAGDDTRKSCHAPAVRHLCPLQQRGRQGWPFPPRRGHSTRPCKWANVMRLINGPIRLLTWCGSLLERHEHSTRGESRFSVWRTGKRKEKSGKLQGDSISNGHSACWKGPGPGVQEGAGEDHAKRKAPKVKSNGTVTDN